MESVNTELATAQPISPQIASISILLMACFFAFDLLLPLGVAGGVPYIAVILVASWSFNHKYVVYFAVTCSVLVILGFYLSPLGGELWKVVANRLLALFSIWVTAALVIKWKIHEEAVIVAREEADNANKAKSEFLSSMSHELRTPMNAILGFGQLLEMDLKGENKGNAGEIVKAGGHLMALIDQVLDLSKIESGGYSILMEDLSLNQLLHECLTLIRPQAKEKNISIIDHISDNKDHQINVDSTRFKQVLLNFLSNAVKYNQDDGSITLSCNVVSPQRLRISVTDTGKGLTEEQVSHLFSPFERLGMENSNIKGTGIGLVISKRLVQMMDGYIGVESQPDSGSTFWIEINLTGNNE